MVLLLDDDDGFREALAELMRRDGHQVLTFAAPTQVPAFTVLTGVTALLVDYQMDGEDGLSFADRFHGTHPALPIVLITGFCEPRFDEQVAARPYLTLQRKPIDYARLVKLLPPAGPAVMGGRLFH